MTHSCKGKKVHAFPKSTSLKVNVIAQLEFELTYYIVTVQYASHNATRTTPYPKSVAGSTQAFTTVNYVGSLMVHIFNWIGPYTLRHWMYLLYTQAWFWDVYHTLQPRTWQQYPNITRLLVFNIILLSD